MHSKKNWLIALLICVVTLFSICIAFINPLFLSPILLLFQSVNSSEAVLPPTPPAEISVEPVKPVAIDYVELLRRAKTYNGQLVQIAGRVGAAHNQTLYIFDRVNFYIAEEEHPTLELKINLNSDSPIPEPGDYCIIAGVWNFGYDNPYLSEATVISTGETAKLQSQSYQEQWELERLNRAKTTPLTNYMDLKEQADQYCGTYVRTAATIADVTSFSIGDRPLYSFYINNERTGKPVASVNLDGVPPEIQEQCQEDVAVIVGGTLYTGGGSTTFLLENCYVEAVGDIAQAEVDHFITQNQQNYENSRQTYIAECSPLDYQAVLMYPKDFRTAQLICSGIVDEISNGDPTSANFIIRLETPQNRRIEVYYSHGAVDDSNILLGSSVTVYGYVEDVYYPKDESGARTEELPIFFAVYMDY